jgi:cation diffusion facilitator family transporter
VKNSVDTQRRKVRAAALSVISNTVLVVMKLVTGLLIGSISIISEAIHSGVDLLAAVIALFSVKTSSIPADRSHPFGHGKIENISGTIEALLIFVAALWIIYESVKKIIEPGPVETVGWGVAVMLVSALANTFISQLLFKVGRETDSIALQADAWHLRTDVYTSAGVMTGLALIWAGQRLFPGVNLYWLDPVTALAVAAAIIKAAYDLTRESAKDLLDVCLPGEEIEWIRRHIMDRSGLIHGFHDLRTRKAGHFRFVDLHLKVDPHMTVADSHAIAKEVSDGIRARFPSTTVTIHVEPCDCKCDAKCLSGCLVPEPKRMLMKEYKRQEI